LKTATEHSFATLTAIQSTSVVNWQASSVVSKASVSNTDFWIMIELNEKIEVPRPIHEAFDYVADFRSTTEWDATASAASKLTAGAVDVGTRFDVTCQLPIGSVTLRYTVTRLVPNQTIELHGKCALFQVNDVIHFSETPNGTHIDYRATFTFTRALTSAQKLAQSGMERMGKASLLGLKHALEDNFPAPEISTGNRRADNMVVPGLALFTKAGYRRGRRRWQPMSAWMGNKHVVITGANSGLGLSAAYRLAELGAELTLVIRNENKAASLIEELRKETGNSRIHVEIADLSLMSEVDRLVERMVRNNKPIDVLINNAGALFNPRGVTAEGLEQSFALLLLSPVRLTLGLKPMLVAAGAARVINVVSGGMYSQKLNVDELICPERGYSGSVAYAKAKRALMVMTEEWATQWADDNIVVNAMHPGWANTPGVENALPGFHKLTRLVLRSSAEGADTINWLAVATEAGKVSGKLFLDREPRTTHLMSSTVEAPSEREKLRQFLANFSVEQTQDITRKAS